LAGKAQIGLEPGHRVGRERRPRFDGDPHLVVPVDLVGRERHQSEFFGLAGIERTLVRLQLRDPWVVAEESRLQPRQPVAHRQRTEVHRRQRDHVLFAIVVEHVGPIGGERELEQ
jgi:hypothetical protein